MSFCIILPIIFKKLALILATFLLMTQANIKNVLLLLKQILYIYSPFHFEKDSNNRQVLLNLESEIRAMILAYILKLGLVIYHINMKV